MDLLANWLWQGSVVALALFVMLRGLHRSRAQSRYLACWAALGVVVLLPFIPLATAAGQAGSSFVPQPDAFVLPPHLVVSVSSLGWLWLAWASLQTATLVRAVAVLRRTRRHASPFPRDVAERLHHWARIRVHGRRPALMMSDAVSIGAVLIGRPPAIAVAPALLNQLDDDELDRVLLHEWAHVQRRDDVALLAQLVIRLLVGWHPAIWWIDRRIHVEREVACDEIVLAITGSPKSYAHCLVKLAELRHAGHALAAPAMRAGRELRERIVMIVSRGEVMSAARSRVATTAMICALAVVGVAAGTVTLVNTTELADLIPATHLASATSVAPSAVRNAVIDVTPGGGTPISKRAAPAVQRTATGNHHPDERQQIAIEAGAVSATVAWPAGEREAGQPEPTPVPVTTPTATATTASSQPIEAASGSTPWARTANVGVDIGQRSKAAGIGTANAFRRFAGRIASSF